MLTSMSYKQPPVPVGSIEEFETTRQLTLPTDYKTFLRKFNGGRPREDRLKIEDVELGVQFLFGLGVPLQVYNLADNYDFFVSRGMPKFVLPVGSEGLECAYYCLDLRKGGLVCIWDQRHHWGTGEWREEDLFKVTDTFDQFLALLVEG